MDGRPIRKENVAFSNEEEYLWTEGQSLKKKLRFQTKTNTCGRGLIPAHVQRNNWKSLF